jgi:ubiquinone biosynthesis protein Coq4
LFHLVKYSTNRDQNLQSAFDADDLTQHLRASDESLRRICEDPASHALVERRFVGLNIDLDHFATLPDGSLGRAFLAFMEGGDFDVDLTRPERVLPSGPKSYVLFRLRQCHDIWHVVTGFDTSHEGEVGLQGFSLSQLHSPMSAIALAGTSIDMLFGPYTSSTIRGTMSALAAGWEMGQRSRPLFSVDWDAHWHRPLNEVRAELGVDAFDMTRLARAA